jgi:iron(III) transport system ATP-binding protein
VTHDQDEALSVADRVAALRDGKIAQCATPEDLYCRPADPELASFVGDANLLEGVLNGGVVKTLLGNLPLDAAAVTVAGTGQVTVLIRPEQIELEPSADGVPGRVTAFGYHGHDAVVHVQPEHDADGRTIVVRITGGSPLAVGSPVNLRARGPVFAWRRD